MINVISVLVGRISTMLNGYMATWEQGLVSFQTHNSYLIFASLHFLEIKILTSKTKQTNNYKKKTTTKKHNFLKYFFFKLILFNTYFFQESKRKSL